MNATGQSFSAVIALVIAALGILYLVLDYRRGWKK